MIDFKELRTATFKDKPTCSQLLYLFVDAMSFIDSYGDDKDNDIQRVNCELFSDAFTIRLRVKDYDFLGIPIRWFSSQAYAFRTVRPDSRYRIRVEPYFNDPSIVDVEYHLFMDLPF